MTVAPRAAAHWQRMSPIPTGRSMHEDQFARLDGVNLPNQNLRSRALEHHRGCLIEGDRIRQSHQSIGLDEQNVTIDEGKRLRVSGAVINIDVVEACRRLA